MKVSFQYVHQIQEQPLTTVQKVIPAVLPAVPQTADALHKLKWWLLGNAQPVTN